MDTKGSTMRMEANYVSARAPKQGWRRRTRDVEEAA